MAAKVKIKPKNKKRRASKESAAPKEADSIREEAVSDMAARRISAFTALSSFLKDVPIVAQNRRLSIREAGKNNFHTKRNCAHRKWILPYAPVYFLYSRAAVLTQCIRLAIICKKKPVNLTIYDIKGCISCLTASQTSP